MKLSISYYSLHEKAGDTFEFIKFCHKNGVKYVELLDYHLSDAEDIKKVNTLLRELEMEVSSYSISNDFVKINDEERKTQVNIMKQKIDIALSLDTKILRVFSGEAKEGISFLTAKEWIVACYKDVVKYAEEKGVTLSIENHGLFVGKSKQVKELIEAVGSVALKATTDTGNFLLANEDPLAAIKYLKNYISFVHFKDLRRSEKGFLALDGSRYEGTALGKGEVPLKEIIKFLKEINYLGFISIECEESGDDSLMDNIYSVEFVKNLL
jgi:sugar phosphate isomerase/epimerase